MLIRKEGVLVNENIDKVLEKLLSMKMLHQILIKFPQVFVMGTKKENERVEEGVFNEMHPVVIRWCLSVYLKSSGKICYLCGST